MELSLKFDLRAPTWGASTADLYAATLDMCEWADGVGFRTVRLLEHHGSPDGYLPSPLLLASAIAARTRRLRVAVRALVLPLHDPLRVAEDVAVLDLVSAGRFDLVVAAGYVPYEFAMFDRDIADRARLLEEFVDVLKQAWVGAEFDYRGRRARVATRPYSQPRPRIVLGGSSAAAARRAARIADGFEPTQYSLYRVYLEECARLGVSAGPPMPPRPRCQFLYVAADVDRAWSELARHLLHESNSYGRWLADAGTTPLFREARDIDDLRASGNYRIVTPEECVALATEVGPACELELHPLVGGLDPGLGWRSLHLFADRVVPALREAGMLMTPADPCA
ncbi:LLM class flavin-dependent oxidoreductase [Nocardioides humi]|uniref:Luciferase-like domain-containing protein n=1 Tax=Nocardioides humi TaxID=449461 RepID=A0ABN1ZXB0_9ACTN|nr:LLM class flavin-dependent oxidoreductase [Nocardioides humi]